MPEYRLKTPALARKVVGLYRKIEQGTVLAYKKIEDRFVDARWECPAELYRMLFWKRWKMLRRKRMKKRRLMQAPGIESRQISTGWSCICRSYPV